MHGLEAPEALAEREGVDLSIRHRWKGRQVPSLKTRPRANIGSERAAAYSFGYSVYRRTPERHPDEATEVSSLGRCDQQVSQLASAPRSASRESTSATRRRW